MTLIHLVNDSAVPFQGWLQCNVDTLPNPTVSDNHVLGKRSGLDTWNLDIYCALQPGETQTRELDGAGAIEYVPAGGAPQMWGGIDVSVAGKQLRYAGAEPNGAGWDGHWHRYVGEMLHADLFVHWYPDEPSWCTAELILTASNPDVDEIKEFIPLGMRLRFGDATALVPGLMTDAPLMQPGDWLADPQARMLSIVLCWPRHGANLALCRAIAEQRIQARGIRNLLATGNPPLPAGFDGKKWAREMLPIVIERSHDWFSSPFDPDEDSGSAGAQGSQALGVAGPAMADALAVGPIYLAALDGSWPMFHLEATGKQLDWRAHPGLRLFRGKVNVPISLDKLGKSSWPDMADGHGHSGPEDEHWFDFILFAGARLKGTPALQWHLRAHAIQFLFRYVVEPPGNWLTANRGVGWAGFLVGELYRGLADRELAEAVAQRWRDVFMQLIYPMGEDGSWWSWIPYPRSASIGGTQGGPARAIPWQACVLALGLDWAGAAIGDGGMRDFAKNIAHEIMGRIYVRRADGRWTARDVLTQDGSDPGPYFGAYDHFGTPMVVATVLRHDPQHAQAREIWSQLKREATDWNTASWLCPGVEVS